MAAIGLADVTYTQFEGRVMGPGKVLRKAVLTFPNNGTNNQYATGGIPLDKGKLGCPRNITSLRVLGRPFPVAGDNNPVFEWNGNGVTPSLVAIETASALSAPFAQQANLDTAYGTNSQILVVEAEGY